MVLFMTLSQSTLQHTLLAAGAANPFAGTIYQAVAAAIVFLVLLFVLKAKAWGPILKGLQDREDRVREMIESAQQSQQQAEDKLKQYEQQLAEARQQVQSMLEKAQSDANVVVQEKTAEAQQHADQIVESGKQQIERAKDQAVQEVWDKTADLVAAAAGKVVGLTLDDKGHRQLIDQSLNELKQSRKLI